MNSCCTILVENVNSIMKLNKMSVNYRVTCEPHRVTFYNSEFLKIICGMYQSQIMGV